jgi:hypothetical protein
VLHHELPHKDRDVHPALLALLERGREVFVAELDRAVAGGSGVFALPA